VPKGRAIPAFMKSPTSMTARSIRCVRDRLTGRNVASKLVYAHTQKTATSMTAVRPRSAM